MISKNDPISVTEFIRENERNLEVAAAIYEHFQNAREDIAATFCKLEADLNTKLPGWEFEYSPFFNERYGAFAASKPSWKGLYRITLECYDWGKRMIYGVSRDAEMLKGIAPSSELLAVVRKTLPTATSRAYFEAEIRMTAPATDWRKPKILWRMASDDTFRKEVAILMFEIAKIAEKQVDALAKKH